MNDLVKVDSQDTLVAAVDDAMARAAAIFGSNERTLIDSVSQSDWDVWDASGEKPNCADASLVQFDDDDFDESAPAAA